MGKIQKLPTDCRDLRSRVHGFDNYHFLTRSTESITRLTSSLARLRVSRRIMPLLFIMAAMMLVKNFPDVNTQIWEIPGRVWDSIRSPRVGYLNFIIDVWV